jgi:hypothetical protein
MSKQSDLVGVSQGAGGDPLFVDAANNEVGIGTTNPLTKFTVSGGYISQTNAGVSTYFGEDGSGGSLAGTTTNHYFRFITNDTERMRIDNAGRVTTPSQPAFEAQRGTSQTGIGNTNVVVQYDSTVANIGNHFNTSNHRFTAPVSGFYVFTAQLLIEKADNTRLDLSLFKNGSAYANQEFQGLTTSFLNTSVNGTWGVYLAQNDFVEVTAGAHPGSTTAGILGFSFFNRFSGFLLG